MNAFDKAQFNRDNSEAPEYWEDDLPKKIYKVWVRVCIEEYDPETEEYQNVCLDRSTGTTETFDDTSLIDEVSVFESASLEEAQQFVDENYGDLL